MIDREFSISLKIDETHKDCLDSFNIISSIFQKFENYKLIYNMGNNLTDSYRLELKKEFEEFLLNIKLLQEQFL